MEHKAPDREFLKSIVVNKFAVPENKSAFTIVQELNNLLGDTDPELRDRLAYSIISVWVGDEAKLSNEQLLLLFDVWRANLRKGVGEIDTDSVLRRSFSTLCLASLAERDLTKPFLGDKRFHELLGDAVLSLKDERDLRGYDLQKGWIHATAHTADLLKFLARNPLLNDNDQKAF